MSTNTTEQSRLINLTIDGRAISVPKGTTVYTASKNQGIEIPIFCYQDRMPPFGACRMCLVEVEKMGKLQASCTLEATEGMVVRTQSSLAVDGRKEIIELLLINHPLDCPICDRGGECPLQDNTLKHGPGESKFFEEKRKFPKPIPLGPVLMLDRERCITCARCTRFGDIVAGDHALEFIDRGYRTEVGTPDGGPAESKFIGNTIMICPVGALTSDVYRFRARPWDNDSNDTTCTLCPVGCSMVLDSRDGEIMRTRSRENREVNDIWMCDKGWFGYEFTDNSERLKTPLVRRNFKLEPISWDEAFALIAQKIKESQTSGKLAGWGGNPLTTEENYLFQKLMRQTIGVNHVDHRIGEPIFSIEEEGLMPGMEISIGDCEKLSYVVLLGVDLTEEFPVIWLRIKQAINKGAKVLFIGNFAPEISKHLTKTILHAPGKELDTLDKYFAEIKELTGEGKKGAIFVGRQYLSTKNRKAILSKLTKFKKECPDLSLNLLEGRGNSFGARLAGMRPDVAPLNGKLENPGLDAIHVLQEAAKSGWNFLYVAGADPATKFLSKLWIEARAKIGFLVVQDLFLTETARQADLVLPTLSYVEKEGSFVNIEGRVQRLHPGKDMPTAIYSDGEIFVKVADKLGKSLVIDSHFSEALREHKFIHKMTGNFEEGNKLEQQSQSESQGNDLKVTFAYHLFDQGVRMQHNPHLSQMIKEPKARIHPNEGKKRNIKDGQTISIKAKATGNTISTIVSFDEKVSEGTLVLPLGFEQVAVRELGNNLLNGMVVEIE